MVTKTFGSISSALWNQGILILGWIESYWPEFLHNRWMKRSCSLPAPIVQFSYSRKLLYYPGELFRTHRRDQSPRSWHNCVCVWPFLHTYARSTKIENWDLRLNTYSTHFTLFIYSDLRLGAARLNNTMWLLFNDLILGLALGSFIREGYPIIATFIGTNFEVCGSLLQSIVDSHLALAETVPQLHDGGAHLVGCMACWLEAQQ